METLMVLPNLKIKIKNKILVRLKRGSNSPPPRQDGETQVRSALGHAGPPAATAGAVVHHLQDPQERVGQMVARFLQRQAARGQGLLRVRVLVHAGHAHGARHRAGGAQDSKAVSQQHDAQKRFHVQGLPEEMQRVQPVHPQRAEGALQQPLPPMPHGPAAHAK